MFKKLVRLFIIISLIFITLHIIFLQFDYNQIKNGNKPIFSFKSAQADDGGSVEYTGLGYKIISYHFIDGKEINGRSVDGFTIGPEVSGIPIVNFIDQIIAPEDLKFVTVEDEKNKN